MISHIKILQRQLDLMGCHHPNDPVTYKDLDFVITSLINALVKDDNASGGLYD